MRPDTPERRVWPLSAGWMRAGESEKVDFSTFRVHSAPPAVDRMPSTEYPASPPPSYEEVQLSICHTITTIRVFLVFQVLKQPRGPPPSYDATVKAIE